MRKAKSKKTAAVEKRQKSIADRVEQTLHTFHALPDEARIEVRVLSRLTARSVPSIWRDVRAGRLPKPVRICKSTRWRVGDVRNALKSAR